MSIENNKNGKEGRLCFERHVEREHEMDTEQKVAGPPIVRTTVEGYIFKSNFYY